MERLEYFHEFLLGVLSGVVLVGVCATVIYVLLFHRDIAAMYLVANLFVVVMTKISQKSIEEE